jgi:hypothetical protein
MSIHLAFERTDDTLLKKVVRQLSGPYVHTELVVTSTHEEAPFIRRKSYSAYIDYVFFGSEEKQFVFADETHDILHVKASACEIEDIRKTCETHVELKTPYNLKDMVFSVLPGRNPKDKNIYEVKTLFCSQAMVLILRQCLEENHPVRNAISSLNSRVVTPSQLYTILKPVCESVAAKQIMRRT